MGAYTSKLEKLDCRKLDCRKAFRKGPEGEKLGDDKEGDKGVDHGDDIPLMGLTSDGDDRDVSHNPDAWTPMNMQAMDMDETTPATNMEATEKAITKKDPNAISKKKEKNESHPTANTSFEVSFGKDLTFQNLDADGFAAGGAGNSKTVSAEASDTSALDIEKETKPKSKTGKSNPKTKSRKGSGGETNKPKSGEKSGHSRNTKKGDGKGGEGKAEAKPKRKKTKPKTKPRTDE